MSMILRHATVVLGSVFAIAANAETDLCSTAERGTYLSNVCWLFEDFSREAFPSARVVGVDAEACTISLRGNETVHLRRANGNLRIAMDGSAMCWTLIGERGIHTYPNHVPETWETLGRVVHSRQVRVCGRPVERSRIRRAMNNLFTRYCPIEGQEF